MTLSKIKKEGRREKINRNLFATSTIIFIFTIILNIINIINNPYLLNGLILEINIGIIIFCLYSWIKLQQRVNILKEKELDIKIRTILKNLE